MNEKYYEIKLTQEEINTLKLAIADSLLNCKKNRPTGDKELDYIYSKTEKRLSNLNNIINVCLRYKN